MFKFFTNLLDGCTTRGRGPPDAELSRLPDTDKKIVARMEATTLPVITNLKY